MRSRGAPRLEQLAHDGRRRRAGEVLGVVEDERERVEQQALALGRELARRPSAPTGSVAAASRLRQRVGDAGRRDADAVDDPRQQAARVGVRVAAAHPRAAPPRRSTRRLERHRLAGPGGGLEQHGAAVQRARQPLCEGGRSEPRPMALGRHGTTLTREDGALWTYGADAPRPGRGRCWRRSAGEPACTSSAGRSVTRCSGGRRASSTSWWRATRRRWPDERRSASAATSWSTTASGPPPCACPPPPSTSCPRAPRPTSGRGGSPTRGWARASRRISPDGLHRQRDRAPVADGGSPSGRSARRTSPPACCACSTALLRGRSDAAAAHGPLRGAARVRARPGDGCARRGRSRVGDRLRRPARGPRCGCC